MKDAITSKRLEGLRAEYVGLLKASLHVSFSPAFFEIT